MVAGLNFSHLLRANGGEGVLIPHSKCHAIQVHSYVRRRINSTTVRAELVEASVPYPSTSSRRTGERGVVMPQSVAISYRPEAVCSGLSNHPPFVLSLSKHPHRTLRQAQGERGRGSADTAEWCRSIQAGSHVLRRIDSTTVRAELIEASAPDPSTSSGRTGERE